MRVASVVAVVVATTAAHAEEPALDTAARAALRARTEPAREHASLASDVLFGALLLAPWVSASVHAFEGRGEPKAVAQLSLVNVDAFAVSMSIVSVAKRLVARERPYAIGRADVCAARRGTVACDPERDVSFVSGHAATAFTGAGLVCAQTAYLGREADGWDGVACAAATASAATTAVLRIVADRHWATDTIAGAAVGILSGLVLPSALHFSRSAPLPVATSIRTEDPKSVALGMAASSAIGIAVGSLVPVGFALALGTDAAALARAPRLVPLVSSGARGVALALDLP